MEFDISFGVVASTITKIFLLAFTGYAMYFFKLVDDNFTDRMSLLLIWIFFPALIISKTTSHFSFAEYPLWWIFPLVSVVFCFVGMVSGRITLLFMGKGVPWREFVCVTGFQNCGYLPITLITFSFAGMMSEKLLIYTFLFIQGFNLIIWSVIPVFLSGGNGGKVKIHNILNPPVMATVLSLIWVAVVGKGAVPDIVADPLLKLGAASYPVAMLLLGFYLCRYKVFAPKRKRVMLVASLVKLLVVPAVIFPVLMLVGFPRDMKFFLLLESMMPSAVSLVAIGSFTGADNEFLSGTVFYTHVLSLVTIPLWVAAFNMFPA
ncbi:MAG: AEC family transporter [Candidatus Omnitrophica bacterium]|nr:AEC family transporter [Candidatus Omnitrophota bacterium]MDD5487543.1 AEC family transporter [Candidatus Omnitrophota bacterium]